MKKLVGWTTAAVILMIGFPWLAVNFAGDAGMAVCFLLFFAANPLFSAVCGFAASGDIRRLWMLPPMTAGLFLTGTWIFLRGDSRFSSPSVSAIGDVVYVSMALTVTSRITRRPIPKPVNMPCLVILIIQKDTSTSPGV